MFLCKSVTEVHVFEKNRPTLGLKNKQNFIKDSTKFTITIEPGHDKSHLNVVFCEDRNSHSRVV